MTKHNPSPRGSNHQYYYFRLTSLSKSRLLSIPQTGCGTMHNLQAARQVTQMAPPLSIIVMVFTLEFDPPEQ
jgi:hypothetical protein